MAGVRITFKNYRGFTEAEPLSIELRPGFTALVGRNNNGKSAAQLFFYEFRNLFEILSRTPNVSPSSFQAILGNHVFAVTYMGVSDVEEVFHNAHNRSAELKIELLDVAPPRDNEDVICAVVGVCSRATPTQWRVPRLERVARCRLTI